MIPGSNFSNFALFKIDFSSYLILVQLTVFLVAYQPEVVLNGKTGEA